jgi:methylmalonyl-CoA/ethylmalonyl-CoA epimerase
MGRLFIDIQPGIPYNFILQKGNSYHPLTEPAIAAIMQIMSGLPGNGCAAVFLWLLPTAERACGEKGEKMNKEGEIFEASEFCQIGIVVKSVDETVKYYKETFGLGPFEIRDVEYPDATYYGEKAGYSGRRGFFYLGPIQIELIELREGKTVHEEFLREKGEGLNHIAFAVKDLKESTRRAEDRGFKVIQGYEWPKGGGFAYLDTDKIGGLLIELIEWPEHMKPKE